MDSRDLCRSCDMGLHVSSAVLFSSYPPLVPLGTRAAGWMRCCRRCALLWVSLIVSALLLSGPFATLDNPPTLGA